MQERQQNSMSRQKARSSQKAGSKVVQPAKSILQLAAEARSLATRANWKKLPTDLSKRFDEYHYSRRQDKD